MSKLTVFLALIFLSFDSTTSKSIPDSTLKTEEWKLTLPKSAFVFQSKDQIVIATTNKKIVNLSYIGNNNFSCAFSTNFTEYLTKGQALGNENFVLFGSENKNFNIVIVNPQNCNYKTITKELTKPQTFEAQIVSYYESFDVFISDDTCSPCRYDDRGQRVELSHGLKTAKGERYTSLLVKSVKQFDGSKGYFCAFGYKNGTSVMIILNERFHVDKEMVIDNEIISAFVSVEGNIEVCFVHRHGSERTSTCQQLSNDFQVIGQSGEHLSREKKFARLIVRPVKHDYLWKTVSVFENKSQGNNLQRTCLQLLRSTISTGRLVCNTMETMRFNLEIFVFGNKGCFSIVNDYGDLREVQIKCLVTSDK